MVEEDISAGSGSTYFFTSLLDCPGLQARARRADALHRAGRLAHPRRRGRAGRRARDLARARPTAAPSTPRSPAPSTRRRARSASTPTAGRCDGVEIRTVDEDGNDVGVGKPGEILSRGPDRFAGYTDPALTAEAIEDGGWFHTGDVGIIDADGYLTITDRVKDIIIRGGENVSAAEVEQLLAHMKGVAEVAVVAAPDERLGEHGCAFFRMQPGSEGPPRPRSGAGPPRGGRSRPAEVARGAARRRRAAPHALGQDPEVRPARTAARRRVADTPLRPTCRTGSNPREPGNPETRKRGAPKRRQCREIQMKAPGYSRMRRRALVSQAVVESAQQPAVLLRRQAADAPWIDVVCLATGRRFVAEGVGALTITQLDRTACGTGEQALLGETSTRPEGSMTARSRSATPNQSTNSPGDRTMPSASSHTRPDNVGQSTSTLKSGAGRRGLSASTTDDRAAISTSASALRCAGVRQRSSTEGSLPDSSRARAQSALKSSCSIRFSSLATTEPDLAIDSGCQRRMCSGPA